MTYVMLKLRLPFRTVEIQDGASTPRKIHQRKQLQA